MLRHHGNVVHQRDLEYEDQDEYEEYEEYEEEDSEPDGDQTEDPQMRKEEQDFLKLREQMKERARKNLKKQIARDLGHSSQSQDRNRLIKRETFGSFFGPSQPVIASRVLEESRSIRETKHIVANVYANKKEPASSSEKTNNHHKTSVHSQRPKVVNEVKRKAQTLKDMRDYSFLLSDDADFPSPVKEQPVKRSTSTPAPDRRLSQAPMKSNVPASKSTKTVASANELKNSSPSIKAVQNKSRLGKDVPTNKTLPISNETRKVSGGSVGNGLGKSSVNNAASSTVLSQIIRENKPRKNANNSSVNKNISSAKPKSSVSHQYLEQKRPNHVLEQKRPIHVPEQKRPNHVPVQSRPTLKQQLPSSKPQPSKHISSRAIPDERLKKRSIQKNLSDQEDYRGNRPKKRPLQRNLSDEEDYRNNRPKKRPPPGDLEDENGDISSLIRGMFGYNPNKYIGMDEDDSDMEVGFDRIQKEERRSSKIAREEDEEQLRLIEEEEEREKQRRKMKKKLK